MEMKQMVTLATAVVGAGFLFLYWRQIGEALRNFRGGGPRPPSHPLPADDGIVVLRKRRLTTK